MVALFPASIQSNFRLLIVDDILTREEIGKSTLVMWNGWSAKRSASKITLAHSFVLVAANRVDGFGRYAAFTGG